MVYIRRNVWDLGGHWADPVLWYARGVQAMRAQPLNQPTSWRFYSAMHGFDQDLWRALGYFVTGDKLPTASKQRKYWKQCQHGSWYFLPWHRGFVVAFEANVRAAVVRLGGPASWALPYWNYFKANQAALPFEFTTPSWPDGSDNPLYTVHRYGPHHNSNVFVPLNQVNLAAMSDQNFTGVSGGGSPGFGGVDTGFSHSGTVHGGVESQPHDWVHVVVGGEKNQLPGLMSDPDTAGLDPIFWLHHANIDRLWASWLQGPPGRRNPTATPWLNGPTSVGERAFVMPMPDGSDWKYAPKELVDLTALDPSMRYRYDDLSPTGVGTATKPKARRAEGQAAEAGLGAAAEEDQTVGSSGDAELIGATPAEVTVQSPTSSSVHVDAMAHAALAENLAAAGADGRRATPGARVFLNLENVRGQSDASAFHVYLGVPAGEDVEAHPDRLVGSVAPFGMRSATKPDGEHGGQGLTFVFDVTRVFADLQAEGSIDAGEVPVRLVPLRPLEDHAQVHIGRISLYRQ